MKRQKPSPQEARQRLLQTCSKLFYAEGIHAIGVDRLAEESGVAKMTLYRHFSSKEQLVREWLSDRDAFFWDWYNAEVDSDEDQSPRGRIASALRAVEKLSQHPQCFGCVFQITAGEYPEPANPGHKRALEHKRSVIDWLRKETDALGISAACADGIYLLMEGVWSSVRMFGAHSGPGVALVEVGLRLLDSFLREA